MLYILPRSMTPKIDQYLVTIPFWTFWQPTHPQGHKVQALMAWLYVRFHNIINFMHIQWLTEVILPPIQNPVQLTLLILCQVRFQFVTLLKFIYASTLVRSQDISVRVVTQVQVTWYSSIHSQNNNFSHLQQDADRFQGPHWLVFSVLQR